MLTLTVPSGHAGLWVETEGDGDAVVMLHAGVADRRMWRDSIAALAPGWKAVAYDRRGFGRTEHADEAYSHVADLLAVLDAVSPSRPAILVGCSQGGRIAIDTALAFPARVRALVLVAPGITGAPEVTEFAPPIKALVDALDAADAAHDLARINALEAHAWLDGPAEKEGRVVGAARELFLDMNSIALEKENRGNAIEAPAAYQRVGEIAVPTLVVWGDLDFPHIVENCRYLAATVPGAQSFVLPGTAHLPNLEQPAAFNRRLVDFCSAVRGS
jgi:pimeloyl-ACP methyl ester carboxylesterase